MILLSSCKYRAIRLHRITLAIIQHLAVIDLILSVNRVFPITISLVTNRWIFGDLLCTCQQYVDKICYRTIFSLTCALTTTKLLTIKYPLRCGVWSTRKAHKLCWFVEMVSLCLVFPFLVLYYQAGKPALSFSFLTYNCNIETEFLSSQLPAQRVLHILLDTILPVCIYVIPVVSSGLMLYEARRVAHSHRQHLRWEGVVTVLLTCAMFYISFIPHNLTTVITSRNYYKAAEFLLNLNVMANFYIYTLTVSSFRSFLRSWCRSWVGWCTCCVGTCTCCVGTCTCCVGTGVRRATHLELTRLRLVY